MPSWKKVITSGSNASLNSLNVISGITGSLLGTASYAETLDGLDSTDFVRISTSQNITGNKAFRDTTIFGISGASDGKVSFVDAGGAYSASISIDGEGNFIFANAIDAPLVTVYQNGDGIYLTSGNFTGNLIGIADTASYYNGSVTNAISSSYAATASYYNGSVISSSFATSASFASNIAPGLTISASNLSVTDTITTNIIVANSASFGYVQQITGSAVIIGQEYIVLNTQTPAARFAGLQIYDSGSSNATASIIWDSVNNKFIYTNASGSTYNGGGFMAGPRNTGSLGEETFPTFNRVLRSQGGDHLYDSNIIDNDVAVNISIPLVVTGSVNATSFTGSLFGSSSYALTASYALNGGGGAAFPFTGTAQITGSLIVTGAITSSTLVVSSSGDLLDIGPALSVYGSGSAYPVFTIIGSQGELFSVTDSLTGSLFSVSDISGLPILEVFSDDTIVMGDYQAPSLYTTRLHTSTVGVNNIYSIPTSSYNGAFFDYVVTSASNARAGTITAIALGTSIQYNETTTADIGNTSGVNFMVRISGNDMVLTGSFTTANWAMKTIIRSI